MNAERRIWGQLRDDPAGLAGLVVVGIGAFAEARARAALSDFEMTIGSVLHPSPASPLANRGWAEKAEAQMESLGLRGLLPVRF